jgi:hypothetical protein
MTPAEPLSKGQWIDEFAAELTLHIRPELGAKHAQRVAAFEWASRKDVPPAQAANQWAAEQDTRRKKR